MGCQRGRITLRNLMVFAILFFGPPAKVYESGIQKTTAVTGFPSLEHAVNARTQVSNYYKGVIEADGTSVENKVI